MMLKIQNLFYHWAVRTFGYNHVADGAVRGLRHVEEAMEICQALDVKKEDVQKALDIVYSRPKGQLYQEIGGSIATLLVLCESHSIDIEQVALAELVRVSSMPIEHFQKRNQEKVNPNHG